MYKQIAFFALLCALFICAFAHPGDEHEEPVSMLAANADFKTRCKRSGCTLTNELVEGPYYVALDYLRSDITEGASGIPMNLVVTVIDFSTCAVIENAAIDIWHANATGVYSHINTQGNYGGLTTTFLRGVQLTDASGVATMTTIMPGWYTGRAIHTHIKVHVGGTVVNSTYYSPGNIIHTGQLFFNQSIMDSYATVSPYSTNTQTQTSLADDQWYPSGGAAALFDVEYVDSATGISGGIYAYATVIVNTTYTSTSSTTTASGSGTPSSSSSSSSTSTTSSSSSTTSSTTSDSSTTSEAVTTTSSSFGVLSAVPVTSLIASLFCFVILV